MILEQASRGCSALLAGYRIEGYFCAKTLSAGLPADWR